MSTIGQKRMKEASAPNRGARLVLFAILAGTVATAAVAADLPGAKDPPLKRFAGSEIVGYEAKQFDAFPLQTSTFVKYNLSTKQREYAKPPLVVEGTFTRIWYEAPGGTSSTELLRNYQNEMKAQGFQILYDSTQDPAATKWVNYLAVYSGMGIQTSRSNYVFYAADERSLRVSTARLQRPDGDVYVSLTAVEWPKDNPTYKARRGAYVEVVVLQVQAMKQNMVVVKASEMAQAMAATGRVALYGIYFDTNKADIKPESRPALEEIAKLMKQEPGLKLHVVGHTDNAGGFEFNMNLSKRRADAVVAALTGQYGIPPARLIPNGVAYLAPVASNTTEEGRAKNRRVELVPQ